MAFGQELRLERERRAISLAAIAEVTKVPTRHLQALETDRFDQLPGGIFAKGILRSYCRHVGLDEQEWLARFPALTTEDPVEPASDFAAFAENVSRSRIPSASQNQMRWWGVLVMLLALSALSWTAWRFFIQPQLQGSTPVVHTSSETAASTLSK